MTRRRIATITTLAALTVLVVLAPVAGAADGEGLYGETDDRVVTFFCFGVIAFFAILVTVLSLLQMRSEARKDRAKQDVDRLRQPE